MNTLNKVILKLSAVTGLTLSILLPQIALADNYPKKPVNFVVGFGVGGSADRIARTMSSFLAEELGQPVKVINKKGAGTQLAANYVLNRPDDGYTVFASTFSPYLPNTILKGNASYTINDFSYMNFQWFDFELIAVNKDTPYQDLSSLLTAIKENPKSVKAAVVQGSGGHLMAKLLLEKNGIPQENLNLVTFNSGGQARSAVAGGQVDFIVISAQGSEGIREFLRPVAVVRDKPSDRWDAPTVNEALKPLGIEVPVLTGSMRGFAVTNEFKNKYPERYKQLAQAFESTLARKDVQTLLKSNDIGGVWVGPERSTSMMVENYETFKTYKYLLD
ncbi:tripartite tricarboxylate transporter substrate binding protein [Photobacterium sp. WH77]|uniref:Bug family tripartite tricarboxylate transporter substrate binding protein n=1 Tax=unclassified Photobacterium TaxID=2628852 RepID=UPI001EDA5E47|nr:MULTISPECIES: tripartite tricarboxylate transporter substrate binding protein [unclassified Photobacterium]MCG2839001.1 tripartite tricarboxylate transporter substrate binding protein [Photobacterium sp. WH77]MCG2846647.1 tripartite tricarboxylate transporter substrate binding protein [Photobacterium sp. WH80]